MEEMLAEEEETESSSPWDEFVSWGKRFYSDPSFDEVERDYKILVGDHLGLARESVRIDGEDWHGVLKKSFATPNNLTHFITHSQFLDWARDEPVAAREAMLDLWDESYPRVDRVQRFCDAMASVISSPGSRVQIASFLLMADPENNPMYRPTPLKSAAGLVGYPEFPNSPDGAIYLHAVEFIDELLVQARNRGLDLRDRLGHGRHAARIFEAAPGAPAGVVGGRFLEQDVHAPLSPAPRATPFLGGGEERDLVSPSGQTLRHVHGNACRGGTAVEIIGDEQLHARALSPRKRG